MASETAAGPRPSRPVPWRDPRVRGIVLQVLFVGLIVTIIAFLVHNTLVNLRRQSIASGFGFMEREAAFGIGESRVRYSPAHTHPRSFFLGPPNTLYGSARGIVAAPTRG